MLIQDRLKQPQMKFIWNYAKDPDSITSMRKELDIALNLFQVCPVPSDAAEDQEFKYSFRQLKFMTGMGLDVAKVMEILKNLDIEQLLERVHKKLGDHIG
jgi:hypothetical protein